MNNLRRYGWPEKVLVGGLMLIIADTIIGGPIGLFFRGERHLILAFIFLVSLYLGMKHWGSSSHNWQLSGRTYIFWPLWFFLVSLIWIFAVPAISGGSIGYAVQDAQSLIVLPIASLLLYVMQGKKIIQILLKTVLWLVVVLALFQVGLWIWLQFFPQEAADYFQRITAFFNTKESVFVFWQSPSTGTYLRIFWISDIWLTIAVFITPIIVSKKRWVFIIEFILGCAICFTYTRGIWVGVGGAMLFCTVVNYGVQFTKKRESIVKNWTTALAGIFCAVAAIASIGYLQHGQVGLSSRVVHIVEAGVIKEPSLALRATQVDSLLNKWQQRPWMGFGYGSYVSDNYSSESRPYLYEMVPFALLMKLGIVGFGIYIAALSGLLLSIVKGIVRSDNSLMFVGATIAFFMAANTNPILYSFVGMVAVLFILIWWADLKSAGRNVSPLAREATLEGDVR